MDYEREMRFPRNINATSMDTDSWFYIDPCRIHIFVRVKGELGSVRLTRRQILAALAIIDGAKSVKKMDKRDRRKK